MTPSKTVAAERSSLGEADAPPPHQGMKQAERDGIYVTYEHVKVFWAGSVPFLFVRHAWFARFRVFS